MNKQIAPVALWRKCPLLIALRARMVTASFYSLNGVLWFNYICWRDHDEIPFYAFSNRLRSRVFCFDKKWFNINERFFENDSMSSGFKISVTQWSQIWTWQTMRNTRNSQTMSNYTLHKFHLCMWWFFIWHVQFINYLDDARYDWMNSSFNWISPHLYLKILNCRV